MSNLLNECILLLDDVQIAYHNKEIKVKCPDCGAKNTKCRLYNNSNTEYGWFFHCFKCGFNKTLKNWVRDNYPHILPKTMDFKNEFKLQKSDEFNYLKETSMDIKNPSINAITLKAGALEDTYNYLLERKIPINVIERLRATNNPKALFERLGAKSDNCPANVNSIVIPYHNKYGSLVTLQVRMINYSMRYYSASLSKDKGVFQLNDDSNYQLYCIEGAMDSLFLKNAVAVGGNALHNYWNDDAVLVYDNEPRNKQQMKLLKSAINNRKRVVIWDNQVVGKDINDMAINDPSFNFDEYFIHRTFDGFMANVEFNKYCKI